MKSLKSFIKKLVTSITLGVALVSYQASAQVPAIGLLSVYTNSSTTAGGYFCLLTNPCKIAQIQLLAGSGAGQYCNLYDNNVTNSTYTNAAYTTITNYVTNLVTTVNGLVSTNSYTNTVLYSFTNSVSAGTNNLPFTTYPVQANTLATYNINDIQSKGIALFLSTSNIYVIVRYRIND